MILKMRQKLVEFEPSMRMQLWMIVLESLGPRTSKTRIARKIGISRDCWYKWKRKPGFMQWYKKRVEVARLIYKMKIYKVGFYYAKKGNYKFWKSMIEVIDEIR